jgi:acyl-CoA dehydrogenase family protein 9
MAVELFAIAACLSRATLALQERGEAQARREADLCRAFVASAEQRLDEILRSFDDNDDDARDRVALQACDDGGYVLDVLTSL